MEDLQSLMIYKDSAFLVLEKIFILPYTGMAAILFNDEEPFEENDNTPSTESPMSKLVKIGQAVSEEAIQ